ncbi:hypothetical protein [Desulforamulus aeronauticus]|uniref:Uncharacterized protein n=1 Tax=Desulforamulus aeronauticus DSM 10349 TaxID=1121421 RepID=A0A1M6VBH5_9FIRM|nr:hypothetical protein [Desulforamulus aeronauticus]SHK78799.1 hypothetical protein SAMN02745123_03114 [Desulforamulus aeronauticus DSM 10349]
MRDKLLKVFIDLLSVWIVFCVVGNPIIKIIKYVGITDSRGITLVLVSIFGFICYLCNHLIFSVLLKKLTLTISFRNNSNHKVRKIRIACQDVMATRGNFKLDISIYGGNLITNGILNWLGSDILIHYRPDSYDTEIPDGWANSKADNLFIDGEGIVRYYWTDCVSGQGEISENKCMQLRPELIICPKRFDVPLCRVYVEVASSKKKCEIKRFLFSLISSWLVSVKQVEFSIGLKV